MILLNFSHPLLEAQRRQIETLLPGPLEEVIELRAHFDHEGDFVGEVQALCARVSLPPEAWEGGQVILNLPGYAPAAAIVLAWAHGLMGHFPTIVRWVPLPGTAPQEYWPVELINLQETREQARLRRSQASSIPRL